MALKQKQKATVRDSKTFFDIPVEIIQTNDATISTVQYIYSKNMSGWGTAKREAGDRFDSSIGEDLAVARALRELAEKLEARARAKYSK